MRRLGILVISCALLSCTKKYPRQDVERVFAGVPVPVVEKALPRGKREYLSVVVTRDEIRVSTAVFVNRALDHFQRSERPEDYEEWSRELLAAPHEFTGLDPTATEHLIAPLYDTVIAQKDEVRRYADAFEAELNWNAELWIAEDVPMAQVVNVLYTLGRAEVSDFVFVVKNPRGEHEWLRIIPIKFGGNGTGYGPDPDPDQCMLGKLHANDSGIRWKAKAVPGVPGRHARVYGFRPVQEGDPKPAPFVGDCFVLPTQEGAADLDAFRERMIRYTWDRPHCLSTGVTVGGTRPWAEAAALFAVVQGDMGDQWAYFEADVDDDAADDAPLSCSAIAEPAGEVPTP